MIDAEKLLRDNDIPLSGLFRKVRVIFELDELAELYIQAETGAEAVAALDRLIVRLFELDDGRHGKAPGLVDNRR